MLVVEDKYKVYALCHVTSASGTQRLLDPTRMLNMQEDAYCRRISAEVMRRCLYKPAGPCRQRILNRARNTSQQSTTCVMQSLPVTPGDSNFTTPMLSPATSYSCFSLFSCSATPRAVSPEATDICDEGLASVLTPRPRYVHASCSELSTNDPSSPDSIFLTVPSNSDQFYSRKRLSASVHHF